MYYAGIKARIVKVCQAAALSPPVLGSFDLDEMATSATTSSPSNWSFHAIAGAFALSVPPHLYGFAKAMVASNSSYTNITPRTNIDGSALKSKVDANTWQKLVRARGCHLNALEGFPLFAAAMIAGNYAKLSAREMNFYAGEYLAARVVYSVIYMTVKSEAASYLRTGAYAWSIGIPMYVLWKAGNNLAETI